MTTRATARHRAEVTKTSSIAIIAKAVGDNAGGVGRQAAVIAAASGLVLTSGIAANAADSNVQRDSAPASTLEVESAVEAPISAASTIAITFEKPAVTTTPAPVVEEPEPVEVEEAAPAPAVQAAAAPKVTAKVSTASAPAAPAASASGKGAAILSAAYAQLGVMQDCTMLVTNSLAAVGINFHDWPAGYLSLGRTVSAAEAQPGDLIYYADGGAGVAHIAVYAGNGQAVHGGYNGNQTVVFSANVGSGPVFIRVN
ncbi:NlpC/P60 family protein [Pseudarthrobacter phenanthrenivorans]|jgi:cell wall-associated NlpC family hydrolase|uniref:NlpC/P60 family protein n=1 Tax=Pseudarthrobacter phenanthrenivorans (strain DSM 18606 / JCM 16027 / LMG 23796 / Sphe3) TaxID=930171 RepID=F0M1T3_PSEPM|nr:NlpC/P60 family protein [Pseudarthrobacter phenanthrenivorans]ADX72029.1 NlpC/P60 family protein [Pseudarthrobacter phenanthrenivorans Sphe3]TPV49297.1 NlpC/P60 family protein [Pseudarthrobacter phenanthrenivorans]